MRGAPGIWKLSSKKPACDVQTSPELQDLADQRE